MCTLSVQLYSDITSVNLVFVSDKIINNSDNFGIKWLFYGKIFSVFTLFYLILENMSTNVRKFLFPCLFDTCDVEYNLSISLLPPIVLDNLFALHILLRNSQKKLTFSYKIFFQWTFETLFYFTMFVLPTVHVVY